MRERDGAHTDLLELFQLLIMLSPQLRPFRKLILGTGRIELLLDLKIFSLKFLLFGCSFRGRCR